MGRYQLRFAQSLADLQAIQRLRFEIFNLELQEGLSSSYATGLDQDRYDANAHHLMVVSVETREVVGTYRIMSADLVTRRDLYADSEFDTSYVPGSILAHGVEAGRACVAKAHRNGRVLQLLWKGVARYLAWNQKRYVFGCCSVPTLHSAAIADISERLARGGYLHEFARAPVRPALCGNSHGDSSEDAPGEPVGIPALFTSYLRLGAKVVGGPAFDRAFGVTDYLVLLDVRAMSASAWANFAAPSSWTSSPASAASA